MKKIAWVTDSTSYIDSELQNHPDVYVIPILIMLDGKQFLEGIDLTPEQLFDKLKTIKNAPTTSQPSVGEFQKLYEKLATEYDAIVSIHISGKLSGTISSSKQAGQLVDIPVFSIDSKLISYPLTYIIKRGITLHNDGYDIEAIITNLKQLINNNEAYVLVGSLEQLHRSGRLTGLQYLLGSVLNVKPIIALEDGSLSVKEKVRSEQRAKRRIVTYLTEANEKAKIKEAFLLYSLYEADALNWEAELAKDFPHIKFISIPLCAAVGLHTGETTIALSWFSE